MADSSLAPKSELPKGLPAVEPPSGKFIAQLFFVPLIIVTALVCFTLLIKWLAGSAWSPDDYLAKLDDANVEVRWRGAETLAQVLLRDDHLASDPRFGLELAERLRRALKTNLADEKSLADRLAKQPQTGPVSLDDSLQPERIRFLYLSACLGNLVIPVGAPVLSEMAVSQEGGNSKAVFQRRRHGLWALVSLGKNLKRFDLLSEDRRAKIFATLEQESAIAVGNRRELAQTALEYLKGPRKGSLEVLGVDKAILTCGADENPFLREMTALALNFWEGTQAEDQKMNDLLARLDRDDGRGEDILARIREEEWASMNVFDRRLKQAPVSKMPGMTISFNATVALARRGSDKARLAVLRKMLNQDFLTKNLFIRHEDGKEAADIELVAKTMEAALQAIAELHRRQPDRDLSELYASIDEVSHNSNVALRVEADKTLHALGRK